MAELLSQASEKLGVPERLLERSSAARAQAEGVSAEEVLQAWLGGGAIEAAPPAEEEAAAAPEEDTEEAAPAEEPSEEPVEEEEEEAAPPVPVGAAPAPPAREAAPEEERELVTVVQTAGLQERPETSIPRWLLVAFLVLPLYALFYVVVYAGGPDCGQAGLLQVDEETGAVLNCDGTPFAASGTAGAGAGGEFLAMGRGLYTSPPGLCASCHGAEGGGGVGPAMAGGAVVQTFPSCDTHVEWVILGSSEWPDPTYGAPEKPVNGGMPTFRDQLTEEEIRSVVLFERVQFGGQPREEALGDCGLAAPEEGGGGAQEGEAEGQGEQGGEGEDAQGDAEGEDAQGNEGATTTSAGG
ncbi:MAG: c-type cytochrome [Actinomycetota bacterium]|nr:c-type cytochrome [Actinomycetota bacterium]